MENKKSYFEQIQIANFLHTLLQIDLSLVHNANIILELSTNVYSTPNPFNSLQQIMQLTEQNNSLCQLVSDQFFLNYFVAKIPNNDSELHCSFIIGPFLNETFSHDSILSVISKNKLPLSKKDNLENFYHTLKTLSKDYIQQVETLITNTLSHPFISSNVMHTKINTVKETLDIPDNNDIKSIEQRYLEQKQLNHIVFVGDIEAAKESIPKFEYFFLLLKDRVKGNYLRSAKNTALIGNTNNRIIAEKAGLHPFYIDQISQKYAIDIERCQSVNDVINTSNKMLIDYCKLINQYRTRDYSPIVAKCINFINVHLLEKIKLSDIADNLNINKSYLCRIFKQEVNCTITEFINRRKINEAIFLLDSSDIPLSEIAYMLGFNDYSYFSKVFKQITGYSPKKYPNTKKTTE